MCLSFRLNASPSSTVEGTKGVFGYAFVRFGLKVVTGRCSEGVAVTRSHIPDMCKFQPDPHSDIGLQESICRVRSSFIPRATRSDYEVLATNYSLRTMKCSFLFTYLLRSTKHQVPPPPPPPPLATATTTPACYCCCYRYGPASHCLRRHTKAPARLSAEAYLDPMVCVTRGSGRLLRVSGSGLWELWV